MSSLPAFSHLAHNSTHKLQAYSLTSSNIVSNNIMSLGDQNRILVQITDTGIIGLYKVRMLNGIDLFFDTIKLRERILFWIMGWKVESNVKDIKSISGISICEYKNETIINDITKGDHLMFYASAGERLFKILKKDNKYFHLNDKCQIRAKVSKKNTIILDKLLAEEIIAQS